MFIQCALNNETHAFDVAMKKTRRIKDKTLVVYNEPLDKDTLGFDYDYSGYLSEEILQKEIDVENAEFYFCGPTRFMMNVLRILKNMGVEETRINYEFFDPKEELLS